jgi:tetratricopeptide (TPR) repeat protein
MTIFYSLKNRKIVAFGMLWFWISFAPSFYIYPIQGLLYEHWLYFPLIGLLICFLVPLFDYLSKQSLEIKKMFILSTLIVFILGLGIRTIIRNSNWHDPINFYEKNVSLGGYSGRVYTNLGMAYADAGRNQEAIDTYQKSIRINADLFQTWYDMGNTFTAMGKNDEAIDSYQKAIEKNPYFVPAYNNLSKIFSDQKKFDAAIQILQKAIEKNPKNIQLLYNLGVTSSQKGDRIQAKKYFQEALSLQPTNIDLIRAFNGI